MALTLARLINPWKYRRDQRAAQVRSLRARDGDQCARCRRAMRFDVAEGHEQGPAIEQLVPGGGEADENLRLCHARCSVPGMDHTEEVMLRRRKANEADLFAKARKRRRKAA